MQARGVCGVVQHHIRVGGPSLSFEFLATRLWSCEHNAGGQARCFCLGEDLGCHRPYALCLAPSFGSARRRDDPGRPWAHLMASRASSASVNSSSKPRTRSISTSRSLKNVLQATTSADGGRPQHHGSRSIAGRPPAPGLPWEEPLRHTLSLGSTGINMTLKPSFTQAFEHAARGVDGRHHVMDGRPDLFGGPVIAMTAA